MPEDERVRRVAGGLTGDYASDEERLCAARRILAAQAARPNYSDAYERAWRLKCWFCRVTQADPKSRAARNFYGCVWDREAARIEGRHHVARSTGDD